jgi:hypothetical protein
MFNILGFITGFGIAKANGLEGMQAAKVAVLPGIMGFSIISFLATREVARREAESQSRTVPQSDKGGTSTQQTGPTNTTIRAFRPSKKK